MLENWIDSLEEIHIPRNKQSIKNELWRKKNMSSLKKMMQGN